MKVYDYNKKELLDVKQYSQRSLKFLYKTIIATMLMTVFIDTASILLPKYQGEKIIAAVFGNDGKI